MTQLNCDKIKSPTNSQFFFFNSSLKNVQLIKNSLISAPVLAFPDFKLDFYVMSCASSKALGAVIGQFKKEGRFVPIMYASRHLTSADTRYTITERDMSGVVFAAEKSKDSNLK
ncbi:unnamed protein product [Brachionus calyciflorus]|uniref:Reverse transcriptase/retrotransposon-derived protein RNase H-like domain-containing protein n=1 Tax=Brachionus calyciflorus TaxID=104777 RepID=A0A814MP64_9BILA|nr:unnamed protein product [Brachionus calyciflorus]